MSDTHSSPDPSRRRLLGAFGAAGLAGPAFAVLPEEQLKDPVLEARAREISKVVRCVVCQNQTIDDSDAPLARDPMGPDDRILQIALADRRL